MKKIMIFILAGSCFLTACDMTSDKGGQQMKSNGQSGDSSTNKGTNNEQMTRDPETAVQMGDASNGGQNSDSTAKEDTQRR